MLIVVWHKLVDSCVYYSVESSGNQSKANLSAGVPKFLMMIPKKPLKCIPKLSDVALAALQTIDFHKFCVNINIHKFVNIFCRLYLNLLT